MIAITSLLFCGVVMFSLTQHGPFDWHFRQPSFSHSFIEVLVVWGLLASGLAVDAIPR